MIMYNRRNTSQHQISAESLKAGETGSQGKPDPRGNPLFTATEKSRVKAGEVL